LTAFVKELIILTPKWCWLYNNSLSLEVVSYSNLIVFNNYMNKRLWDYSYLIKQYSAQLSIQTDKIILWMWLMKAYPGVKDFAQTGDRFPVSQFSASWYNHKAIATLINSKRTTPNKSHLANQCFLQNLFNTFIVLSLLLNFKYQFSYFPLLKINLCTSFKIPSYFLFVINGSLDRSPKIPLVDRPLMIDNKADHL